MFTYLFTEMLHDVTRKEPVAWYWSKMRPSQMDTSTWWCTCTRLVTQWSTWRKRRSISSSLTYGPQTARILIPSITLSGMPFSSEFITDENSRLWKNWSKQLSLNGKSCRNVSLIVVSMNGVVVLNVLPRMAVGISNIAISLSNSLGCCAIVFLLWLSIEL